MNQSNPWTNSIIEPIETLEPIEPLNQLSPWTNFILQPFELLNQINTNRTISLFWLIGRIHYYSGRLGFRTNGGFRVKKFGLVVFWKIPNDRGIFFSGLLLFVCDRALFVIQPKKRNSSTGVEWTHRVAWKHSLYMVMMMVDSQGWVETHGGYFDIGLFRSILTLEILRDKFMQLRCKMPTKHHLVTAVCQGGTPSQGHLH